MSNDFVTQNDLTQILSCALSDLAAGRKINKTHLEKQIEISDAINRRLQTKINLMKVMIEARKSGFDFAQSIKEVNVLVQETSDDLDLLRLAE